jgi:hypothetical protein
MVNMKFSLKESLNQFKIGRELHKAEYFLNKFNLIFSQFFPGFYSLLYCDNSQYEVLRGVIAFFIGTFYAITIWFLAIFRIEKLSNSIKILLLTFKILLISSSMASCLKFRCIMTLAILKFIFKSIKLIIISYIIVRILKGPVTNIYLNLSELGESIVCQHRQLTNMTNMQKENLIVYRDLIKRFLIGHKELTAQKDEISVLINGLNNELEGQEKLKNASETRKTGRNMSDDNYYYEKNLNRCFEIFKSGESKCMDNMKIVSKGFFKKASSLIVCEGDCETQSANESCLFENLDLYRKKNSRFKLIFYP